MFNIVWREHHGANGEVLRQGSLWVSLKESISLQFPPGILECGVLSSQRTQSLYLCPRCFHIHCINGHKIKNDKEEVDKGIQLCWPHGPHQQLQRALTKPLCVTLCKQYESKVKPCAVEGIWGHLGHLLLIGTFPEPTTRLIKQKGMHENYIADQNQKVLFGLATIASY